MAEPQGFTWSERKDGAVVITHDGRQAATLRGRRAAEFLEELGGDDQLLMARVTGNYRRGNERQARNHPRNR